MEERLLIGVGLTVSSIFLTAIFGAVASSVLRRLHDRWRGRVPFLGYLTAMSAAALWMLLGLGLTVWLWALTFRLLGQFSSMEEATYFAVVAFTTLGFGDVLLDQDWRLLSGVIAANGLILFSLITAFLIQIATRFGNYE